MEKTCSARELSVSVANKVPWPGGAPEEGPLVLPSLHLKWSKGFEKARNIWLDGCQYQQVIFSTLYSSTNDYF